MGRSRQSTVSFFKFSFSDFLGFFYFITFSDFDYFGYLNVPHHLICDSPSKHERNFHTLPECHN